MYERPAMDVSNAETQAAIADSLMDDRNIIATIPHSGGDAWMTEGSEFADRDEASSQFSHSTALVDVQINEDDPEGIGVAARFKHGDATIEAREAKLEGRESEREESDGLSASERGLFSREERIKAQIGMEEQLTKPNNSPEQPELTVEQFQPIVESTYKTVKDLGMIEAPKLAADLAPFFEKPIAEQAEKIGLMVGGLTLGASQLLTDLYDLGALDPSKPMEFEKLPPLPAVACNYLAEQWCAIRHQTTPARDPITLGNAMRNGLANLIHSKGKTDPQMAVQWVQVMEKASTGRDIRPSEKEAMAFIVDALTPHIRGGVGKFNAAAAQSKPAKGIPRMSSAKKYDGIRTPSVRKQVRQTGNGLDAATLAVYQREHGRL